MKNAAKLSIVICIVIFFSGCSIKHRVADDYGKYLANNAGTTEFTQTDYVAEYSLTPNTVNHRLAFRAATAGAAHLWIVEFGKVLEATLESSDVQSAFRQLSKASGDSSPEVMKFKFDLQEYIFEGFQAKVRLNITVSKNDAVILDKTYYVVGKSQGGKVMWGGAFAMKNAIHQSTKAAVDEILSQALNDMK